MAKGMIQTIGYPEPTSPALCGWYPTDTCDQCTEPACVTCEYLARTEAENALRESEERFRNIANATPVMIWLAGLDSLCYWFNAGWLAFTGRTLAQEAGNGWVQGVHPDDCQRCLDFYLRHFERRQPFQMEYRLRHHSGEYRWVLDSGTPRFDAGGGFLGFIGSCVDAHEVRTAKNQLAALSDAIPGVVYQCVTGDARTHRFVYVSQGIEALYGIGAAQALADPHAVSQCVLPEDVEAFGPRWCRQPVSRCTGCMHFASAPRRASSNGYRAGLRRSPRRMAPCCGAGC